jgi:hypothetical protein
MGKLFYTRVISSGALVLCNTIFQTLCSGQSANEGIADPDRVCIYGGSYGGYACLAGLTFTPDLYKCGVDIVGPLFVSVRAHLFNNHGVELLSVLGLIWVVK